MSGEIRACMADAIRAHRLEDGRCVACGDPGPHQSLHQADVLLKLFDVVRKPVATECSENPTQPVAKLANVYRLSDEALAEYAGQHTTHPGVIRITDEGVAVVESGLSLRQAHEIKTGCSPAQLCDECRRYLT